MNINPREFEAVVKLPAPKRYEYFVKKVADWEAAWGLYQDGWALAGDDAGDTSFPLWPARQYAEACAKNNWIGYEPKEIRLDDLLEVLLPKLTQDKIYACVFYAAQSMGVVTDPKVLARDLESEAANYQ